MEQARLLIAIVLSFLVFLVWDFFFVEKTPVPGPDQPGQTEQKPAEEEPYVSKTEPYEGPSAETGISETDIPEYPAISDTAARPPRMITVKSPFYTVQISEKDAMFKSFVLNDYRETVEKDSPFKEMLTPTLLTPRAGLANKSVPGLESAVFSADTDTDTLMVSDQPKTLSFSWDGPGGVVLEKSYRFSPETYMIGLTVKIKNGSAQAIQDKLTLSLAKAVTENQNAYGFQGPSALINDGLNQVKIKNIEDKGTYAGKLKWVAIEDRYFISAIVTDKAAEATMRLSLRSDNIVENQYVCPATVIRPGTQYQFDFGLFLGPKSLTLLSELGNGLDQAIYFGWFDFIAKPCLGLMNYLYHFIPNYGIAIIILTLLIKIVLWPLGNKGYKSMNEMKKLQPLMTEIREKHKDDKKMMNQELMSLYRTYKINPMGGCLPMVLQIPVFIALYRMLYEAIELRHAPFFLWINDLSAPDRLFNFDVSIPFMQPPYGIPVLTIVMGATMFLQQKMSPPPGDPTQAKMMMFLPIVFTVIFINFSSGLVLYWLINNVLSISQQYYVSKKKTS